MDAPGQIIPILYTAVLSPSKAEYSYQMPNQPYKRFFR
jgi:hypothetical protein